MKTWVVSLLLVLGLGMSLIAWGMRPDSPRAASVTAPVATETSPPREAVATSTATPVPSETVANTPVRAISQARGNVKEEATPTPTAKRESTRRPKPLAAPAPIRKTTLYVRGRDYSGANLRAMPSVQSRSLSVLPYAAKVEAEAKPRKGADGKAWYKVAYRAKTGYVSGALLSRAKPAPKPEPPITLYAAGEGYEAVNMRARPSTDAEIVSVIPYGAKVQAARKQVRGADGAPWYEVTYRSQKGYMLGRLLSDRTPPAEPTPAPTEQVAVATPEPDVSAPVATPEPEVSAPVATVGLPSRLTINTGSVQVDAPVEYVGLTPERAMETPDGWWNVGWYELGPRPGEVGNAVLAGHLDSTSGPAVFWDLAKLQIGDEVSVTDEFGDMIRFVVRRMEVYGATDAPLNLIFGPTEGAHLNLITCQGTFSGSAGYDSRLVVFTDRVE